MNEKLRSQEAELLHVREDVDKLASENEQYPYAITPERFAKIQEELEDKSQRAHIDLELAHKDLELLKHKMQSERSDFLEQLDSQKKANSEVNIVRVTNLANGLHK